MEVCIPGLGGAVSVYQGMKRRLLLLKRKGGGGIPTNERGKVWIIWREGRLQKLIRRVVESTKITNIEENPSTDSPFLNMLL